MKNTYCIILAAGKGKRLNSDKRGRPKALEKLKGKVFLDYALDLAAATGFSRTKTIVVIGYRRNQLINYIADRAITVTQDINKTKGTAMAVNSALPCLPVDSTVLVIYVDQCFFSPQIADDLICNHHRHQSDMTIMSSQVDNPTGFGRIIRDSHHQFVAIVEEKDTTPDQKKITEVNTGTCVFKTNFLTKYLPQVTLNPTSGEYYLTDLAGIGYRNHQRINIYLQNDLWAAVGINTPEQLNYAHSLIK